MVFAIVRVLLDAFARRHEGQKIYLRQAAAERWAERRAQILGGGRPSSSNRGAVRANDEQLRVVRILLPPSTRRTSRNVNKERRHLTPTQELSSISDQEIYTELQASDISMGRWTAEDPSPRRVLRWIAARR